MVTLFPLVPLRITSFAFSERSLNGVSSEKPYSSASATRSAWPKLFESPLFIHPITAMAPSFRDLDLSGIIRSTSSSLLNPKPVHTGQAPKGLLKEKLRGSISSMEISQSGHEKLSE